MEADLPEESRSLVESMLENALLMQNCLQEGTNDSVSPHPEPASDSEEGNEDVGQAA